YLKDRQFYILPLIVLTLANIYWTGSKGPAMGLIGGTAVFSFLVIRFFVESRKVRIAVFASAGFVILALGGYVVKRVFYRGDVTSFTFRMYTWLSTWEMINAKPILGNGIGTYWVLYPAYRRPSIFHIEGKHNTETDHSENEHLEVWMDEGIVGMGLWIWMIAMISIGVYRALSMLTTQPARAGPGKSEKKFPEEAYYMLGTVSGFLGMLIHNITDVSMRFVSSGAPFWLLAGFNAALVLYCPMPEKQISGAGEFKPADETSNPTRKWIKPILRVVTVTVVILVAIRILRQFDWCQGRDGMKNPNESPHFFTTWTFFLLCWGSSVWWFLRIALQSTRIKTLLTVLTATILLIPFWGHFVGDVNHNRAIFFSKQGMWVRSSESDGKVGGFPPEYQIMYRGSGGGTTELDSSFGKVLTAIFPDMIWRK
ncbi:MAG: O-antigen ligase family protein, partial [Elusimicrobia bacterium]|nr:O-antigen ligase family protein [Elusimicrobiota bacterium]